VRNFLEVYLGCAARGNRNPHQSGWRIAVHEIAEIPILQGRNAVSTVRAEPIGRRGAWPGG
jgi:hypothetical protein